MNFVPLWGSIFGALPILIWLYILLGRGGFWRVSQQLAPQLPLSVARSVAIVIPARNEANVIGGTIISLLQQRNVPNLHIFVIDDASTDDTASIALSAAKQQQQADRVTVIKASVLPPNWTGKLWAVFQGVQEAAKIKPDYLLLTDADIEHDPDNVSALVALAEDGGYDLTSFMVKLQNQSLAEKLLIPAFVFFFFLLYPPAFVQQNRRKLAGAAGGCMLVKPEMLAKAGGIAAISSEIIDDCALARLIKQAGGRVWLGLTRETRSTRSYRSFAETERMIARTAFNQLNHSPLLLVGTLAGLVITYLLPLTLVLSGVGRHQLSGAAAWALMTIAYLPMIKFYRQNAWWAFLLPGAAVFYAFATFHSAVQFWTGKGGQWKGRAQDSALGSKRDGKGL